MFPSIISRSISAGPHLKRDKREEESLKTRKLILKAGSSARKQEIVIKEIVKTNENVLEKYKQLKSFTKKSKENRKEISQKGSWLEGCQYLMNQERNIQRDITSILENVMISSLSINNMKSTQQSSQSSSIPVNILIRECLDEYQSNLNERNRDHRLLMKRYQELKEMLNRTKGVLQSLVSKPNSNNEKQQTDIQNENDCKRRNATTAIFADILRQMSQAHSLQGMDLGAKYVQYQQEVDRDFIKICTMKNESKRNQNQTRIEEELEANPDVDTSEVYVILQEWRDKIEAVDIELEETLTNLNKEKEAIHFEYCLQAGCDENDILGGWKELDHQILVKEIKRAQTKGIPRNRLTETLIAQLPHISPEEISRHEDWYRCIKSIQERKKNEINTSQLKREEILKEAKESLINIRKKVAEENLFREEREKHEKARMEIQKSLHLQRMMKMEELQGKLAEIEQQRLKALEDERKENERRMNEINHTKQLAEQYKQERQKYLESQKELERIRREEEIQEKKRQIELAKPKVEQREMLRLKKLEDMRRNEELLLAEELHRGKLLNKLAEQVPYWDTIQTIESKLDHVTVATEAQKYIPHEEETRGHLALNGFADAKLFKDARFRLGLALREAGVHQSAAAAAVIAQLHPRQQAPW